MSFSPDHKFRRALTLWLAALCLLWAGIPLTAQDGASPAQPAFQRAKDFADAQNHRAARIELMNAIEADPDWAPAHVALAITDLRLFDPVAAETELHKAVKLGTAIGQLRHLLGESYWLQGRYPQALAELEADDIAPEHRAYAARIAGRVHLDQGDMDAARAAFDRALAEGGDDALLWTDIGRFRLVSGDMGGAIQAAERAIAIEGRNVRALEFRGRMVRSQFGLGAALPWFEQGLTEAPDDVPLLAEYGATLGDLGRHADMLKVSRKIAALEPDNPKSYYMQAVIAARAHEFALAKRLIAKTGGRMDDLPAMLLLNGAVEYGLGNDLIAAGLWSRLSEMQPFNQRARLLAARALYRAGDAAGAADKLPADTAIDGASYGELILARAFEAMDKREGAMTMLNRSQIPGGVDAAALSGDDGGPAAAVRARVAEGDYDGALALAGDLQRRNPGVADAHMMVGDLLAETGDIRGAMDAYARAEALDFSPPLMMRMVQLAQRADDPAMVRDVLARFLRFNPANLSARRMLAGYYLNIGASAAAAALYGDLIAVLGPNDALLQADYARALLASGDAAKALDHARIAYRVQPGNPVAVNVYGYIALEADKPDEAVEILEKAALLLPGNALARQNLALAKKAAAKDPA